MLTIGYFKKGKEKQDGILDKMKGYSSFEEFKPDHDLVRSRPNDAHLIESVKNKILNSKFEIRSEIDSYLCDFLLETNPYYVFEKAARENPDCFLILNSPDNPWFIV